MPVDFALQGAIICLLLAVATITDLKKREIPDSVCVFIALAGLMNFSFVSLLGILPGVIFFMLAVFLPDSLGGGDVKLLVALGFAIGIHAMMTALVFILLFIFLWRFFHQIFAKNKCSKITQIPLAPFIAVGYISTFILNFGGYYI